MSTYHLNLYKQSDPYKTDKQQQVIADAVDIIYDLSGVMIDALLTAVYWDKNAPVKGLSLLRYGLSPASEVWGEQYGVIAPAIGKPTYKALMTRNLINEKNGLTYHGWDVLFALGALDYAPYYMNADGHVLYGDEQDFVCANRHEAYNFYADGWYYMGDVVYQLPIDGKIARVGDLVSWGATLAEMGTLWRVISNDTETALALIVQGSEIARFRDPNERAKIEPDLHGVIVRFDRLTLHRQTTSKFIAYDLTPLSQLSVDVANRSQFLELVDFMKRRWLDGTPASSYYQYLDKLLQAFSPPSIAQYQGGATAELNDLIEYGGRSYWVCRVSHADAMLDLLPENNDPDAFVTAQRIHANHAKLTRRFNPITDAPVIAQILNQSANEMFGASDDPKQHYANGYDVRHGDIVQGKKGTHYWVRLEGETLLEGDIALYDSFGDFVSYGFCFDFKLVRRHDAHTAQDLNLKLWELDAMISGSILSKTDAAAIRAMLSAVSELIDNVTGRTVES